MKVVYNACFGGFGLSKQASILLADQGVDIDLKYGYLPYDFPRHDPRLVEVVEKLGEEANGQFAQLKIHELSGDRYRIDEYDGNESVIEPYQAEKEWITIK